MRAKIYQPTRNAMQSGRAKSSGWVLEFVGSASKSVDPLMGWTSSSNTDQQVRLSFDKREDAIAYCQREGIAFQVTEPRKPKRIIKTYADNFATDRKRPWTH